MTKATQSGSLIPLPVDKCTIVIPGYKGRNGNKIVMNNLPEISDTKSAVYNSEGIIGRSTPLYTYSHSADRNINFQIHFFVVDPGDESNNLADLRAIQSAVYPRPGDGGLPYKPPPVCKIKCGDLITAKGKWICAVLQSYSVRFPTEVAWDTVEDTFCPYRFDVDTSWLVVYSSAYLPYQKRIIRTGR
jgi:hypothetical protein